MISIVIPAAGSGSRMNQECPKALTPFLGSTFLEWQIAKFKNISKQIYVVVAPEQLNVFEEFRRRKKLDFYLIVQGAGKGSFYAVDAAMNFVETDLILVCWIDQIGISKSVIIQCINKLRSSAVEGLVPLLNVTKPYVQAVFDSKGRLSKWEYTREGDSTSTGFTDLGLFLFKTKDLRRSIASIKPNKMVLTNLTKEFNFLDFLIAFSASNNLELLFTEDKLNAIAVNNQDELLMAEKVINHDRFQLLFSIIIPSYNEGERISNLLKDLNFLYNSVSSATNYKLEVIFVDDGSTDNTQKILTEYKFNYFYQKNSGKGSAVKLGVDKARGDYILVLDADGEYLVSDIPSLIHCSLLNPLSVIYGSRYMNHSLLGIRTFPLPGQSILNLYFNYLLSFIIATKYKTFISDSLTGYKLYPREVYKSIKLVTQGFETDHEISKALLKQKTTILEIPVSYFPRSKKEGKKISIKDAIKALILWLSWK